jgi:hypothetical protein
MNKRLLSKIASVRRSRSIINKIKIMQLDIKDIQQDVRKHDEENKAQAKKMRDTDYRMYLGLVSALVWIFITQDK